MEILKSFLQGFSMRTLMWVGLGVMSLISLIAIDGYLELNFIDECLSPKYEYKFKSGHSFIYDSYQDLKERNPELKCREQKYQDGYSKCFARLNIDGKEYIVEFYIGKHDITIHMIYTTELRPWVNIRFSKLRFWERWAICRTFKREVIDELRKTVK